MSDPLSQTTAEWPRWGPEFNRWNLDVAEFAKLIQDHPMLWLCDGGLKYLVLNVDTRDGGFTISDHDGNRIEPERVMKAAEESEKFGKSEVYRRRVSTKGATDGL